jgi:hypothetical protein
MAKTRIVLGARRTTTQKSARIRRSTRNSCRRYKGMAAGKIHVARSCQHPKANAATCCRALPASIIAAEITNGPLGTHSAVNLSLYRPFTTETAPGTRILVAIEAGWMTTSRLVSFKS